MYRQIFVPLDGSKLAEKAIAYARFLAIKAGTRLTLARVVSETDYVELTGPPNPTKAMADATDYLATIASDLKPSVDVDTVVSHGQAAAVIAAAARERGADLIVMSRHNRGGLAEFFLGSVGDEVVRQIVAPTLVIPEGCERAWTATAGATIVVPLDGSELAESILNPARDLARVIDGRLRLVQVVPPSRYVYVEGDPDLKDPLEVNDVPAAELYLEQTAEMLRRTGANVEIDARQDDDPAAAIVAAAKESDAAAIAMATHGRGGLTRLVLGSVAHRAIQSTTTPVLLVRGAGG